MIEKIHKDIQTNLRKYNQELVDMNPEGMLKWGYEKFDNQFAITTSFGIQSSVLLDMVSKLGLTPAVQITISLSKAVIPTSLEILILVSETSLTVEFKRTLIFLFYNAFSACSLLKILFLLRISFDFSITLISN